MKVLRACLRFCRPPCVIWVSLETGSSMFQVSWPLIRRAMVIFGGWTQRLALFKQIQVRLLTFSARKKKKKNLKSKSIV